MYQYFMGRFSNWDTKSKDQPLVIAFDNKAYDIVNDWLTEFSIDFDEVVKCVCKVSNLDLISISSVENADVCGEWNLDNCDEKLLIINFEDNKKALFACIIDEEDNNSPKIFLEYTNETFICNPITGKVETAMYTFGGKRFDVTYSTLSQKVNFYEGDFLAAQVTFDGNDEKLYDKLVNNFSDEVNLDELLKFVEWFIPLLDRRILDMTIRVFQDEKSYEERLDVKKRRSARCMRAEGDEIFAIDSRGSWASKVKTVKASHQLGQWKYEYVSPEGIETIDMAVAVKRMDQVFTELTVNMKIFDMILRRKN